MMASLLPHRARISFGALIIDIIMIFLLFLFQLLALAFRSFEHASAWAITRYAATFLP